MRSLLWKEWHEQSWKLGFGCLVLGAMAVIGLHSRIISDDGVVTWVCVIGIGLLPILASTGLIPAERAEGSLETLIALPVEPRKILLAKTVMGLSQCAVPLLLAATLSGLVAQGREITQWTMFREYACSALASISLFMWMMALTTRLPSETRAAMVATGVTVFWGMVAMALYFEWHDWLEPVCPLGFVISLFPGHENFLGVLIEQLLIMVVLWTWTSIQFKHVEDRP